MYRLVRLFAALQSGLRNFGRAGRPAASTRARCAARSLASMAVWISFKTASGVWRARAGTVTSKSNGRKRKKRKQREIIERLLGWRPRRRSAPPDRGIGLRPVRQPVSFSGLLCVRRSIHEAMKSSASSSRYRASGVRLRACTKALLACSRAMTACWYCWPLAAICWRNVEYLVSSPLERASSAANVNSEYWALVSTTRWAAALRFSIWRLKSGMEASACNAPATPRNCRAYSLKNSLRWAGERASPLGRGVAALRFTASMKRSTYSR